MYMAWLGKPLDIKDPISIDSIVWNNPSTQESLKWQTFVSHLLVFSTNLYSWAHLVSDQQAIAIIANTGYNSLDVLSLENKVPKRPWKDFCPEISLSQILYGSSDVKSAHLPDLSDVCFTKKVCKRWAMALSYPSMLLEFLPGNHNYFELVVGDFASDSYERNFLTTILAWLTCFAYGGIHSIG
jgi:hypothetical protein